MSKMQIGAWPLPTDVINATLGTNFEDGILVHLTPLGTYHIQKNHSEQAEEIRQFFSDNWLENPILLGSQSQRLYLVYNINFREKQKFLKVVICDDNHENRLSIVTAYITDRAGLLKKIKKGVLHINKEGDFSFFNDKNIKKPIGAFQKALSSTTALQSVLQATGAQILQLSL